MNRPNRVLVWLSGAVVLVSANAGAMEAVPVEFQAGDAGGSPTMVEDGVWQAMGEGGQGSTQRVAVVEGPVVEGPTYSVYGEVRYQGVEGEGYLVLWNSFPDGKRYFTKTLEKQGAMGLLQGDSDWRPVVLPFHRGDAPDPQRLIVELVLPGAGTVALRNLRFDGAGDGLAMLVPGAWWTPSQNRMVNGVIGIGFGLLGALTGILAKQPGARPMVLGAGLVMAGMGIVTLVASAVAVVVDQPGYVRMPLGLVALLGCILGPMIVVQTRRLQTKAELRRLESHDLANA